MELKKVLIATGNKGKLIEFQRYFNNYNIECVSLEDKNIAEPEENGNSFKENSYVKAKYYCEATKLPALADDSGLSIDQLDGMPGIYSARWAGKDKDFAKAIEIIKLKLKENNKPLNNLTGAFHCALCLVAPNQKPQYFLGSISGKITFPPRGDKGFGYDPIFIPTGDTRTFGEMSFEEKQIYAHRAKALEKLQLYLNLLRK